MAEKECSACMPASSPEEDDFSLTRWISLSLGALLLLLTWVSPLGKLAFICFLTAYLLCGYDVLLRSVSNVRKGEIFDENFLMTLATLGAFAIGEYPEAVAVMLFYQIGERLQDYASGASRGQIVKLVRLTPVSARVLKGTQETDTDPHLVQIGQIIRVRAGERVALDGQIIRGSGSLDLSALTGESRPEPVFAGKHIPAGSISLDGVLDILVEKTYQNSAIAQIIKLTEEATAKKSKTEKFITRFARIYTPVVVGVALALAVIPPLFIASQTFHDWIYRALIFLVISCPCALVLAVPLSFFGGIGGGARQGILIKGSSYLEQLARPYMMAFDKTGTLTKGVFCVTEIIPQAGITQREVLETAVALESHSNHPVGKAVMQYAKEQAISSKVLLEVREIAGEGMISTDKTNTYLAGNARLMKRYHIAPLPDIENTCVYVAENGRLMGIIVLGDQLKDTAQKAVTMLKNGLVKRIALLSGDTQAALKQTANQLNIEDAYGELLPQDKVTLLEKFIAAAPAKQAVIFVGDGINDAPVLKRADVGIAMGHAGADIAMESADVVIAGADPVKLVTAVRLAQKTLRVVKQNVLFALSVKAVILLLGVFGLANMWMAVFADVGVSLLAVGNGLRPLYFKQ